MLVWNDFQKLFPVSEMDLKRIDISIITLSYRKDADVEQGAKNVIEFLF